MVGHTREGIARSRWLIAVSALVWSWTITAGCASDPAPAQPAAPSSDVSSDITIADSVPLPEGRGWFCGTRCGRSRHACDRASAAHHRGDLQASHHRIASPVCRAAAEAYCVSYRYTLADVTDPRVPVASTPSPVSERVDRHGHECYPAPGACEEAADQRRRHGYHIASGCAPSL